MAVAPEAFERLSRDIVAELGIKMPEAKLTMLQNRLVSRVRNKTGLFREPEYFAFLDQVVLPARKNSRRFHVSTLATVLAEFAFRQRALDFAILATDVSTRVLHCPRASVYDEAQIQPVPAELRGEVSSHHLNRIACRLVPGGYFFADHSESLVGLDVHLNAVKAFIYRKVS